MTATMEKPAAPVKKGWPMPYVEIGMLVNWYMGAKTSKPYPAVVSSTGEKNIDLVVLNADYPVASQVGCRHVDDPGANEADRKNAGSWEHTPFTKKLMALVDDFRNEPDGALGE